MKISSSISIAVSCSPTEHGYRFKCILCMHDEVQSRALVLFSLVILMILLIHPIFKPYETFKAGESSVISKRKVLGKVCLRNYLH